jgi:transcriptional regulator with XRE-family HTH domain
VGGLGFTCLVPPVPKPRHALRPTFLRQWRKHRGLTLERAGEFLHMTGQNLGKIERGEYPYDQPLLERAAELYACEPVDLLIRDPSDPEGIWSIWESAQPGERRQALRVLKALKGEEEDAA